jgi:hypothetical protein
MGCAASVKMFYGVCYEYDSPDAIHVEEDGYNSFSPEGSPARLLNDNTSCDGIRVVAYRHLDVTSFGLAIAESIVVGNDWMSLNVSGVPLEGPKQWIDRIVSYANKHSLTINAETRFGYWIVPYYG